MNVYIGIGNTDNKLTQQEWAAFIGSVEATISGFRKHGAWFSRPDAPWQNACWLVDFTDSSDLSVEMVKSNLRRFAAAYSQDSIAWAVAETEFLTP